MQRNPEIMYCNSNGSHAWWLMDNHESRWTTLLLKMRGRIKTGNTVTIETPRPGESTQEARVHTTLHPIKTYCFNQKKNILKIKYQWFSNNGDDWGKAVVLPNTNFTLGIFTTECVCCIILLIIFSLSLYNKSFDIQIVFLLKVRSLSYCLLQRFFRDPCFLNFFF